MAKIKVRKDVMEQITSKLKTLKNENIKPEFVEKLQKSALNSQNEQITGKLQANKNLFHRGQFDAYKIKKAVLFGSYAKGNAVQNSDVDILVDSGMKGLAFFGLVEDIVTALDKDADILDVSQIIPDSDVEREINKTGVLIYGS